MKYIVGDWVEVNNKKGRVIAAYLDGNSHIYYVINDGEDNDEYVTNEIQGIPLTPEILRKNGWKKAIYSSSKGQSVLLTKDFCDNIDWITIAFYKQGTKAEICQQGKRLSIPISYIHQLQHLLFGLGLNSEIKL